MLWDQQMLEQTRASKIRNGNLQILFMETPYCGDCVRSLQLVKGMRRTFIGQKATLVFRNEFSKQPWPIAMSFFVRKKSIACLSRICSDCNNGFKRRGFSNVHFCNCAACH